MIRTERLLLRQWREEDREPFAALNADPVVMEHFASTMSREASDAFVDFNIRTIDERGWGLWAVDAHGTFIGFVGLNEPNFMPGVEIGWRLARDAWGHGYATEAALASLAYGFETLALPEIVAVTTATNLRSQAVMCRIGMARDPAEDFDDPAEPEGPLRRSVLYRIRP